MKKLLAAEIDKRLFSNNVADSQPSNNVQTPQILHHSP